MAVVQIFWVILSVLLYASHSFLLGSCRRKNSNLLGVWSNEVADSIRTTDYLRNPWPAKRKAASSKKQDDKSLSFYLEDSLLSFNSESAKKIVDQIVELRKKNADENIAKTLDTLLIEGPDRRLPVWTKFRPLARFSKRARLASLRRTLDLTTPPPNIEDEANDDTESQKRRRRRALLSLLRTLSSPSDSTVGKPAILVLEKKARKETQGSIKEDMTTRRPADLETPEYTVVAKQGSYEIRSYKPYSLCSVSMNMARPADSYKTDASVADPKMAGARAFGALAGYLFGKNQEERAMKMTTPVFNTGDGDETQMSFVLPSEYWKGDGFSLAPKPIDGSGVRLELLSGGDRAVLMFGGYASKKQVEAKKKELLEKLSRDRDWERLGDEPIALAQYNDPFTPPWKRLNEVSVAVRRIS